MNRRKDIILLIGLLGLVLFFFDSAGILRIHDITAAAEIEIGKDNSAADQDQPVKPVISGLEENSPENDFFSISRFVLLSIGVLLLLRLRHING